MQTPTPSKRTKLRRITAAATAAALAVLGLSIGSSPALAHDVLTGQSIETASDGSLTGITLSFNNEIIDIGSEIHVTAPDGSDAADGAPVVNGRDITQNIAQPAAEGQYDIDWRVVSSDGHPIQGTLSIEVDADGVGAIIATEDDGHDDHDHGDDETDEADHDHGDSADEADHDHGDEVTATEDGDNTMMTTLIIVGAAIVVIGAGAAVVVGAKRRREAIEKAGGESSGQIDS